MAFCSKCGDEYPDARAKLGYRTCLLHGEEQIKFTIMPVTKSNYIIATSRKELAENSYATKGPR